MRRLFSATKPPVARRDHTSDTTHYCSSIIVLRSQGLLVVEMLRSRDELLATLPSISALSIGLFSLNGDQIRLKL